MRWIAMACITCTTALACGGIAIVDEGGNGSGASTASGGSGASSGTGASSSTTASGGSTPNPDPLQTSCPGDEIKPCNTDLYALTFSFQWGDNAVFVGTEGSWVAGNRDLELGVTGPFALWLDDEGGTQPPPVQEVPLAPTPTVNARAVDIASIDPNVAEMLVCDGPTNCIVYAGTPTSLQPQPQTAIDTVANPEGMVLLGEGLRCIFGDGVTCQLDDSLWVHQPAGSGPRWLAAAATTGVAWLVGEGGAIARIDGANFSQLESPTTVDLHAVTAHLGSEAVAAGDQGTVVILNDSGASAFCTAVGDDWRGVARRYGAPDNDDFSLISFGSWYVKNATNNQWCKYAVETDVPIEMDHRLCGSSTSWRILLGSRLYGGQACEP
jgi:hypothetical protein